MFEKGLSKVLLVRAQEEKRKAVEKAFIFLERIHNHVQNVGRNTDSKGHSDDVPGQNKEQVIGQWRKDNPCYKVAKNLAELYL